MKWQTVTQEPSALGESAFWHPRERLLYWVDIPGRKILRANPVTGAVQSWEMPLEPGCIAPAASGGLVVALRDGIYRAQEWGVGLRLLHRIDHDVVTTRFNDGKADPQGRFWAGTMYEPRTSAVAELLSLDCRDGRTPQVQRMAGGATIANGLAWSPDQRQVYWADTLQHTIWVWDWNAADNTMSGEREFHRFAPKPEGWHSGMDGYGLMVPRSIAKATITSPCSKASKSSSSRPTAASWPRSKPRSSARRCPVSAAMTSRPCMSLPRVITARHRNWRRCRNRAASSRPGSG